jgi:sigma-B regulation protein RsbU (phosphoserine phosphatase)
VLPEASFLARAQNTQDRAILLATAAVLGALVLGLLLSRRLAGPLLRLTAHVARLGSGDFAGQLELGQAKELRQLSTELNRMATGLKHRMELQQSLAVATHVQQSLLPRAAPRLRGLDVAGQSRYCDSTGGDYYDFIQDAAGLTTPRVPGGSPDPAGTVDDDFEAPDGTPLRGRALIAVGDVTGHGIGAALLMATARAAVRTGAHDATGLGELMSRVNEVLSRDARHGLFMTLSLLLIDGPNRRVRWSTAGHDPVIVYDPAADRFDELVGGDVPLGIEPDVKYRELCRDELTPGTVMVAGTDGIWEARNRAGEMFGKDRLRDVVRAHAQKAAGEIAHAVDEALNRFGEDCDFRDDVTFVIIKVLGVSAADNEAARARSPASAANRGGPAAPALRV